MVPQIKNRAGCTMKVRLMRGEPDPRGMGSLTLGWVKCLVYTCAVRRMNEVCLHERQSQRGAEDETRRIPEMESQSVTLSVAHSTLTSLFVTVNQTVCAPHTPRIRCMVVSALGVHYSVLVLQVQTVHTH
jgi:translation elongation factor EF-Tu-like GTPase